MAIVKMKRLRLAALAGEKEALLQALQLLGCVELSETDSLLEDPDFAALVHKDPSQAPALRTKLMKLTTALEILQKYDAYKAGLFPDKPQVGVEALFSDQALAEALDAAGRIEGLEDQAARLAGEQGRTRAAIAALEPWADCGLPLELEGTKSCGVYFLTAPSIWKFSEIRAGLRAETDLADLSLVYTDREQHYMTLLVHNSAREAALTALRQFGANQLRLGEYRGSAAENIQNLKKELEAQEKSMEDKGASIAEMAGLRPALQQAVDRLNQDLAREDARGRLLLTEKALCLEGWVPEEAVPELERVLTAHGAAWDLSDPDPESYPEVPVKLKNNIFTRCLNMVTEVYSLPAYGSVDPNPLMAPFFILFYGIMMADMGYGILMFLAGLLVCRLKKPQGGMRNFFELLTYCGITTFAFGFITGGCFGNLIPLIVETVHPGASFAWPWPILFTPLDDTIMILLGSLALGFVQIITGMVIGFIRKAKAGKFLDALLDEGAWWVIYAGVALLVLGKGNVSGVPVTLVVGGIMLFIGSGRGKKGFGKITGVFAAIYNGVTGIFSDVLSYSRLMALMLAGSVIAQVFNTIGSIPGNLIVLLLVSLIGNALNFALNLLGCFVHDLRLQCLEYFGKFYEDGGRAFNPLAIRTKYVQVNTVEK